MFRNRSANSAAAAPLKPELERQRAALVRLCPHIGIDRGAQDLLRCFGGHLLDLDAALARRHDHHAPRRTVDHGTEVQLARDIHARLDIDPIHRLPVRIRLDRDHAPAKPMLGEVPHAIEGIDEPDPARLAASTGMHLHLADPARPAEFLRRGDRRIGAVRRDAGGYRHAIVRE